MKNKNLDAFKAKANSILMTEALLNISGGQEDPEYCHLSPPWAYGKGKSAQGYKQEQIDKFFSNKDWAQQFDSMYDPKDPSMADQREAFFKEIVAQF